MAGRGAERAGAVAVPAARRLSARDPPPPLPSPPAAPPPAPPRRQPAPTMGRAPAARMRPPRREPGPAPPQEGGGAGPAPPAPPGSRAPARCSGSCRCPSRSHRAPTWAGRHRGGSYGRPGGATATRCPPSTAPAPRVLRREAPVRPLLCGDALKPMSKPGEAAGSGPPVAVAPVICNRSVLESAVPPPRTPVTDQASRGRLRTNPFIDGGGGGGRGSR